MPSPTPSRKGSHRKPLKERRAAPDAKPGSLHKIKGVLNRPIGLERRDGKLQVVLTERRRARPADEPPSVALLCAELSARLLAHEVDEAAQTMRQLIFVHDALARGGWSAVEGLSALVLGKALEQVERLAREEPSPHIAMLIEALRPLHSAGLLRDQRESLAQDFRLGDSIEVSESDFTEFEDAENNWVSTMPAGLVPPPERDD